MSEVVHHIVKSGETLSAIARHYATTVEAIAQANRRIENIHLIHPGEIVHVPLVVAVPPTPTPEPTAGVIARVDYTGAPRKNGLTTPGDLKGFWKGDFGRFAATFDSYPGAQLFDGYTRHFHNALKRGPGIEVAGFFNKQYPAVSVRWTMHLEEGWSFGSTKFGGKLGGLTLGENTRGGAGASEEGGSVRLNWREDGFLRTYVYHADQPSAYGDADLIDAQIAVGRDVELGLDVHVADGRVVTWMDGKQVHDSGKGRFRWGAGVGVSGLSNSVRFGGGSNEFGPANACYSRFLGAKVTQHG